MNLGFSLREQNSDRNTKILNFYRNRSDLEVKCLQIFKLICNGEQKCPTKLKEHEKLMFLKEVNKRKEKLFPKFAAGKNEITNEGGCSW
jgi:hypothetical protein